MTFKLQSPIQSEPSTHRPCACGRPIPRWIVDTDQHGAKMRRINPVTRCGSCPLRHATDAEIEAFGLASLPRCHKCDAPCIRLSNGVPDKVERMVYCLQCYKRRMAVCTFPFHTGKREKPIDYVSNYAWKDNRRTVAHQTNHMMGRYVKVNACLECANRHKLQPWSEYASENGSVSLETGEVTPLEGSGQALVIESDPLSDWGGIHNAWWPKGNASAIGQWVAFIPNRIVWFPWKRSRVSCLYVTRYLDAVQTADWQPGMPHTCAVNTDLSCVVHYGIKAWVEAMLERARARDPRASMPSLGYLFAGVVAVGEGGKHTLFTSTYREDSDGECLSVKDWTEQSVERMTARIKELHKQ